MKQRGIALLIILFILLLMSIPAININQNWLHIFFMTATLQVQQQDKWILLGAETVLRKLLISVKNNSNIQQWVNKKQYIYLDDAIISVNLFNDSACFNINALYNSNFDEKIQESYHPEEVFKNLLIYNGVHHQKANEIMSLILNRKRSNNSRLNKKQKQSNNNKVKLAPVITNRLFQDITELRMLPYIDKYIFNRLKGILCALPDDKFNINTLNPLHSQLLVSFFPKIIDKARALEIINMKPTSGWHNVDAFIDHLLLNNNELAKFKKNITTLLTIEEIYFHAIMWIEKNGNYFRMKSTFKVTSQGVEVIQRQYGINE